MSKQPVTTKSEIVKDGQPDKVVNKQPAKTVKKAKPRPRKKVGAKGKYQKWLEKDGLIQLEAWARNGLTNDQIAKNMGVALSTYHDYVNRFKEISDAIKRGKEVIDFEVENSLLKRALGYFVDEEENTIEEVAGVTKTKTVVKRKHIPGDTTAQIFWLKNRKPEDWRDRRDIQLGADEAVSVIIDYGRDDDDS